MLLLCIHLPNNIAYGWKVCILPLTICDAVMNTTDYIGLPLENPCDAAYRRIKIISKASYSTQNRKVFHSSVYGAKETITAFSALTDVQTTDGMSSAVKCTMEREILIFRWASILYFPG